MYTLYNQDGSKKLGRFSTQKAAEQRQRDLKDYKVMSAKKKSKY